MNDERIVRRAALGRKHPGHRVFVKRRRGQPVHRFSRNGDNAAGMQNLTGACRTLRVRLQAKRVHRAHRVFPQK